MNQPLSRREFVGRTLATAAAASTAVGAALRAEEKPAASAPATQPAGTPQIDPIKKALQLGMLPGASLEDKFKLAKDIGFDGIESDAVEDPKEVEARTAASKKVGIPIHSVVCQTHWSHPLSHHDPKVVEVGMRGLELALRNAHAHGATTVLLVPALVSPGIATYSEAYVRSQEQIQKAVPLAAELGVILGIENVWNNFLLSPIEFARYIDEFKSPFVQAYFDIGNVVRFGFSDDWIRTLGPRICKMHIKEATFSNGKYGFPQNLGEGDVNWPAVRQAIDDIRYAGFITTEIAGGDEARLRNLKGQFDKVMTLPPAKGK